MAHNHKSKSTARAAAAATAAATTTVIMHSFHDLKLFAPFDEKRIYVLIRRRTLLIQRRRKRAYDFSRLDLITVSLIIDVYLLFFRLLLFLSLSVRISSNYFEGSFNLIYRLFYNNCAIVSCARSL